MAYMDKLGTSASSVRAYFIEAVFPLAQELGLVSGWTFEQFINNLCEMQSDGDVRKLSKLLVSVVESTHEQSTIKDKVLLKLVVSAICVEMLHREKKVLPDLIRLGVVELQGYLQAMQDARADTVRRGAKGRRLIGATTREKVRAASLRISKVTSKDSAANEIAATVRLSPAHVRRLLGELFPGEQWPPKTYE